MLANKVDAVWSFLIQLSQSYSYSVTSTTLLIEAVTSAYIQGDNT